MSQWAEIRHQHFVEGVPRKELARRFGLDVKTVRRALIREEIPIRRQALPRPCRLDPWRDEIRSWLEEDPKITAKRIRTLLVFAVGVGCVSSRHAGGSRWSVQRSPASQVVQAPLRGRHRIPVGAGPSDLLLMDDRRTLVCKNAEEHTLSIIDLSARGEVARIRLPVAERRGDGEPTEGYLTGLVEDRSTKTLWAVSNEGQICSVDMRDRSASTRYTSRSDGDIASDFLAAAWDPDRARLLISAQEREDERGVLLAFVSGRLQVIAETTMPIWNMQRRGSMLYFVSSRPGVVDEGAFDSAVGAINLRSDHTVLESDLAAGYAESLVILSDGRLLLADSGLDRLLEYAASGALRITREMGDLSPAAMHAGAHRVAVMEQGHPVRPILIYQMTDGGLSPSPVKEFPIHEGELGGVVTLPGGGLAVSLHRENAVLLLGAEQAKRFRGFSVSGGERPGADEMPTTGR